MANIEKSTSEVFLTTYVNSSVKKIEDCLNKKSIARLKRESNLVSVIAFLRIIIGKTANYFNVSGNMNQDQVIETANDILNLYYFLSIEDFKLCFEKGRQLRYGQVFRMDGSIILGWLDQYVEERSEVAEQDNLNKHNEALSETDNKEIADKDFYDKFTDKNPEKPKEVNNELQKVSDDYHKDPKAYMKKLKKS